MNPINNQGTESPNKNSGSSRILNVALAQATPQINWEFTVCLR